MEFDAGTWWLALILLGALTGACAWMFKRSSEKNDQIIEKMRNSMVSRGDFDKEIDALKGDVRKIQQSYTTKQTHDKDLDEIRKDIKRISENYLTKDDYFREQARMEKKIDQILSVLMKGTNSHE